MSKQTGKAAYSNTQAASPLPSRKKRFEWKAFVAVCISVLSLIWTIVNQIRQDNRVDALNEPKIVVDDPFVQYYRAISMEEFDTTKWGYRVWGYVQPDRTFRIPFYLEVSDSNKHKFNGYYGFSCAEIVKGLHKAGYDGKFCLTKVYTPIINLRNIGQTDALNLHTIVDMKLGPFNSTPWQSMLNMDIPVDLSQNEYVHPPLQIEYSAGKWLPDSIYFRLLIDFRNKKGRQFSRSFDLTWDQRENIWGRMSIPKDLSQ
jgi:hypothetical protein